MIKTCSKCKRIIHQKSVSSQGYTFHPECFVCVECKKVIKENFNFKGTSFYHTACYQKKFQMLCNKCKKPIDGKYVETKVTKYHEDCYEKFIQLKCTICKKPIESEYNYDEAGKYHPECYKTNKALRCDVCQEVIEGQYVVDLWDHKAHKKHDNLEIEYCHCCSRIISEKTSKGSIKYNDGRKICGICKQTEIIETHQTVISKLRVIEVLKTAGFNYIPSFIKIELVDKVSMNKMTGASITTNTHGCTRTVVKSQNGKLLGKEHSIAMLYGLPKLEFEGVLAHELLHVWLHEKNLDMPSQETEGFCNLGALLIYQKDTSDFAKVLIKKLEQDSDKVYGDGYRIMLKKLQDLGWAELIKDVLNYKPKLINKVVE